MDLSSFNVFLPAPGPAGDTIVHNTLTGGAAVLDQPTLRRLLEGATDEEEARSLAHPDVGILVPRRGEEQQRFETWFRGRRKDKAELSAIVSTTLACNLACTYCCQERLADRRTMTGQTAEVTAAWLARRARWMGAERVSLEVTGGEPLLQPGLVEEIVVPLRRHLRSLGVELSFGLVTNGVLLERRLVERWQLLGLARVQVTLDGDARTHRRTRPSRDGADSFTESLCNALAAAHLGVAVTIGGNYTPETLPGFPRLVEVLRGGGLPRGSRVRFRPARRGLASPDDAGQDGCHHSTATPEVDLLLADTVRAAGFDPGAPLTSGPCGFHREHHFAIDPEGWIYECAGFLGERDWALGHVAEAGALQSPSQVADPLAECQECEYRPVCFGGCVAARRLRRQTTCDRGQFDRYARALIAHDYRTFVDPQPEQEAIA